MNPSVIPSDAMSRRSMIITTGVAATALATLSACGGGGEAPSGGTSSAPATGGTTTTKTADIPVGSGKIFPDTATVVTQPTKGEFKAFSSICTHQNCPVTEVTTTINCKCHGSKFSLTDGSVINPPAPSPLPAKTVKVDGTSLTVS